MGCGCAPCEREHRIVGPVKGSTPVGVYLCVRCSHAFVMFGESLEEAMKILAEVESENV